MNQLYREHLLEIYAEKKNFGELKDKTHEVTMKSPSCNDIITIELNVKDRKIIDAKFHGNTCFVSTVTTEMILENIKGMELENLKELNKEDLDKFLGIEVTATRTGCELFPLEALKKVKPLGKGTK